MEFGEKVLCEEMIFPRKFSSKIFSAVNEWKSEAENCSENQENSQREFFHSRLSRAQDINLREWERKGVDRRTHSLRYSAFWAICKRSYCNIYINLLSLISCKIKTLMSIKNGIEGNWRLNGFSIQHPPAFHRSWPWECCFRSFYKVKVFVVKVSARGRNAKQIKHKWRNYSSNNHYNQLNSILLHLQRYCAYWIHMITRL